MKISKLFHWLYAILMLLPVFAVGVKCGYVMFNKNAHLSYEGQFQYATTNTYLNLFPYTSSDLVNINSSGDKFYLRSNNLNQTFTINFSNILNNSLIIFKVDEILNTDLQFLYDYHFKYILIGEMSQTDNYYNIFLYNSEIDLTSDFGISWNWDNVHLSSYGAVIQYPIENLNTFYKSGNSHTLTFLSSGGIVFGSYRSGGSKQLNILDKSRLSVYKVDSTLSAVFYSAIQELDNVSFFSWAKNSFLAQPFMYIGNLFGIPNVHPIFTFLSYWMAISVIWLVFDLFIYVPLLCHRWIDKGIKE